MLIQVKVFYVYFLGMFNALQILGMKKVSNM